MYGIYNLGEKLKSAWGRAWNSHPTIFYAYKEGIISVESRFCMIYDEHLGTPLTMTYEYINK